MIKAIRQSKLVLSALLLLICWVVLCPHATHEPVCEGPEAAESHDHAAHDEGHDRGRCEFDTAHTHEFRISSKPTLCAPSQGSVAVLVIVPPAQNPSRPVADGRVGSGLPDDPLRRLNTVRLLV